MKLENHFIQNIIILLLISMSGSLISQEGNIYNRELNILHNTETSINVHLLTQGWSIGYDIGRIETYYRTTYKHIEIGTIHHFKEFSNTNKNNTGLGANYNYGKQNSLYMVRAGKGKIKYLSDKSKTKGVTVGYKIEYGLNMGFLKPYYLMFERDRDGLIETVEEKYSDKNADEFLNDQGIKGASGFGKGIFETKLIPGAHAKIAGHFSLRASSSLITALDIGLIGDVFIRKVPLMILQKNRPYFFNLYVTLHFGKRKS